MDEQERENVARGALALEMLTHFFADQIVYGALALDPILELVSDAEGRAIAINGTLSMEIAQAAEVTRTLLRNAVAKRRREP